MCATAQGQCPPRCANVGAPRPRSSRPKWRSAAARASQPCGGREPRLRSPCRRSRPQWRSLPPPFPSVHPRPWRLPDQRVGRSGHSPPGCPLGARSNREERTAAPRSGRRSTAALGAHCWHGARVRQGCRQLGPGAAQLPARPPSPTPPEAPPGSSCPCAAVVGLSRARGHAREGALRLPTSSVGRRRCNGWATAWLVEAPPDSGHVKKRAAHLV